MTNFNPNTKHIIDCKPLNEEVITRLRGISLAQKYRTLWPRLFPFKDLPQSNLHLDNYSEVENNLSQFNHILSKIGMRQGMSHRNFSTDYSEEISYNTLYNQTNSRNLIHLNDQLEDKIIPESKYFKDSKFEQITNTRVFKNEPELTFFGTISMKPSIEK